MDKLSKKFLDYLESCADCTHSYSTAFPKAFGPKSEVFAMIRYLKDCGYVETVQSSATGTGVAVRLSHKGIHRKEFRREERIRYLEDKWIDFLALIVSLLALTISGITLIQSWLN